MTPLVGPFYRIKAGAGTLAHYIAQQRKNLRKYRKINFNGRVRQGTLYKIIKNYELEVRVALPYIYSLSL